MGKAPQLVALKQGPQDEKSVYPKGQTAGVEIKIFIEQFKGMF